MPTYVDDGSISFAGGQNDGLLADRIREDQYEKGINVTTRDGTLGPRPGFVHKEITVVSEGSVESRSYKRIFKTGKFQAATSYDTDSGQFIIVVISGIIFRVDPRSLEATVIPIGDGTDRLHQYRRRVNWSYAGRFLVFYDFPNQPVILENFSARRSDRDRMNLDGTSLPEVPASVLGAYVQSRLWVASPTHEFTAGDPIAGINSDAPITFEEVLSPAGPYTGQVFSLGSQSANKSITAMGVLQLADTSTGVGPLFVATSNSVYLYQANLPRSDWEQTSFGRLVLYNAGIAGSRAFVNQNSDLIFLSSDNQIRSLLMGKSEQERWENTPISREVSGWLEEFEQTDLTCLNVVGSHNNRIFISVGPYRTSAVSLDNKPIYDYAHGGMVVLELDNISALGSSSAPAWAGLWTGISPMEMVSLQDGMYFFSKDDGRVNRLYFLDETKTYDVFEGETVEIVSRLYTREYNFGTSFQDKKLGSVNYSMSDIEGDFKLVSEYKPGHSDKWSLWGCFGHTATTEICDASEECGVGECALPILNSHSFREIDLGDPVEKDCDPLTNEQSNVMRKMQLRLTIKGKNWKLRDIHLRHMLETETDRPSTQRCSSISSNNVKKVCGECEPNDWEIYRTAPKDAAWPRTTLTL